MVVDQNNPDSLREQQAVRREALENIQEISRKAGLYDDDF